MDQDVQKKGRDGLTTLKYRGDPGTLTVAQQEQLKHEVATGRFKSAAMARTYIQDHFHKSYSLSGTRKLLQRLGCTFHKVSSFLFKAKRDKQEEFVGDYESDKSKAQLGRMRRYFVDGVHPWYRMEVLFYCWLVAGQRLELGVGGGRQRLNILGAFNPDDHEYLDRRYVDQNLNAQSVIALFELMMARHPSVTHFRIYLDNARYQHAKVLQEWIEETQSQRGVTFDLKYLPAYSPDLNLIERLWKLLRKEALQAWHPSFEAMQQAVAQVLDNLTNHQAQLKTLMTERFHLSPDVSTIVVGIGMPRA